MMLNIVLRMELNLHRHFVFQVEGVWHLRESEDFLAARQRVEDE